MAGGAMEGGDEEITGINVTPLVDIMLVLLIIFMVTANYIANQTIQVKLPQAETAQPLEKETVSLNFTVDKDSKLYLDGVAIGLNDIGQKIIDMKKEKPGVTLQALISADVETKHGAVVKLIDIIRKNDVSDFAINVEGMEPAK